ncbi:hypothetical protein MNF30_00875 [Mycoplasma mycoides subsp. capri]|uniref:hypothetical protein n=1 Tax=Mycoplasma mycoides TaxID=2102 RepID=UPI00223F78F1|nr:hypothetical protein [Mycoplasma mycoides]UZK64365.1 hypothetical protein MNF30_00875 [Mycoplasma mycoides subsp. capri]
MFLPLSQISHLLAIGLIIVSIILFILTISSVILIIYLYKKKKRQNNQLVLKNTKKHSFWLLYLIFIIGLTSFLSAILLMFLGISNL